MDYKRSAPGGTKPPVLASILQADSRQALVEDAHDTRQLGGSSMPATVASRWVATKMPPMVDSSHPESMYGIGEQRGKAWLVNVQRHGVDYAKAFWFRTHGGRESALEHARAWRDAQLAQHPPIAREQLARKVKPNNTSGYPGIQCRSDSNGKPQRWVAVTQISPKTTLVKSFSISRFGYEGARALAIEERERQLEQMQGFVVRDPFAAAAVNREATTYPAPHLVPKQPPSMTPGVHLVRGRSGKPQSWVAQTQSGAVRERAAFSIAKYGEIEAKQLALAERQAQLERLRCAGGRATLEPATNPAHSRAP